MVNISVLVFWLSLIQEIPILFEQFQANKQQLLQHDKQWDEENIFSTNFCFACLLLTRRKRKYQEKDHWNKQKCKTKKPIYSKVGCRWTCSRMKWDRKKGMKVMNLPWRSSKTDNSTRRERQKNQEEIVSNEHSAIRRSSVLLGWRSFLLCSNAENRISVCVKNVLLFQPFDFESISKKQFNHNWR